MKNYFLNSLAVLLFLCVFSNCTEVSEGLNEDVNISELQNEFLSSYQNYHLLRTKFQNGVKDQMGSGEDIRNAIREIVANKEAFDQFLLVSDEVYNEMSTLDLPNSLKYLNKKGVLNKNTFLG